MKTLKLSATLMLLGALSVGMAQTIDEQITAIQNASPEERVTLVNEFKTTLSTLSSEERAEAIAQLRASMPTDTTRTQTQTKTKERSRLNQMEQTESMKREQNMNQNQVPNQSMRQGTQSGDTPNKFMNRKQ
ncbi:MAG: hypothetical protein RBR59_07620 [Sulfurimonadaceae bacterium]|jgi:hypothetical protein|nr:hypothetical protein [Sulfurimonadaceae bacterium]